MDADALARAALAPGTPGHEAVRARFGEVILARATDETDRARPVDRARLAGIVFSDPGARADLEAIVPASPLARLLGKLVRPQDDGVAATITVGANAVRIEVPSGAVIEVRRVHPPRP